jgi:hypothetical protein
VNWRIKRIARSSVRNTIGRSLLISLEIDLTRVLSCNMAGAWTSPPWDLLDGNLLHGCWYSPRGYNSLWK